MRAVVRDSFGSPDVVEIREVEKPTPADDEVLVRVRAASINPADWYGVTGRPWVAPPADGARASRRRPAWASTSPEPSRRSARTSRSSAPGDEVFGGRTGALAEYVCVREERAVVLKPANVTFEEAAAVPVAALTALQGLRDKGQLQPGQKVLINGASGGVGTFAVQIAKALGAEVTGVCSTRNVDLGPIARRRSRRRLHAGGLHAERPSATTCCSTSPGAGRGRSASACSSPQATLVIVGAPKGNRLLGPLSHIVKVRLAAVRSSRKVVFFIAKLTKADLDVLRELLEAGTVTPVIDRRYELSEIADAFRYLGEGHARGKVVLTV